MSCEKGLVSVIMPTYKRADKLKRAIMSVLNQTYKKIELLVVNDNEPEDEFSYELVRIIESIVDSRLSLVNQEKHINGAAARNAGIRRAKGEYIAFLDDDDFWREDKLKKQVYELRGLDKSWGGVSCKKKVFYNDTFKMATLPYKSGKVYEDILLRRIEMSTGTVLLRHDALKKTGFFDESLKRHQEVQLITFFSYQYKIKCINEYLHNADISDDQNRPDVENLIIVKKDFFKSVEPILSKLSKKRQKRIYIMHNFELGYAMLKNKQYSNGVRECLKVMKSPVTLFYALERTAKRMIGIRLKSLLR